MLYDRFQIMRELLSETGSIYVHLGWQVSAFIKPVLDEVFGPANFQNEIFGKGKPPKVEHLIAWLNMGVFTKPFISIPSPKTIVGIFNIPPTTSRISKSLTSM